MVTRDDQPVVSDERGLPLRQLRRPEHLKALAHPRRMQLLDLLVAEGPLTASQCAERLGDSAASCSYHLRQLARFGFVVEAEGGAGRNRPWRWAPIGNHISAGGSPAERAAAEALGAVLDARNLERIRGWSQRRANDPWREAADASDWTLRLTEQELADLVQAITALIVPLQKRTFDGVVPDGSRLVDVLTYLLPRPDAPAADA
ncbi:helix-turn-helix domain-containing protein [Kineococcus rhizosphaerae]|uniref:ArsR family transcriptional regulator n=1 Tax=Kineococcus rhizosphaerae TaxID=559628 RepID=A0A2T0RB12_9ACTN|nr:helix-turn-helix domain-containing protein [Kineococcus rhizosphaerae]PRY18352.1 ArsR family transcriptional regulator [Kineococcus rhizosphaerae]